MPFFGKRQCFFGNGIFFFTFIHISSRSGWHTKKLPLCLARRWNLFAWLPLTVAIPASAPVMLRRMLGAAGERAAPRDPARRAVGPAIVSNPVVALIVPVLLQWPPLRRHAVRAGLPARLVADMRFMCGDKLGPAFAVNVEQFSQCTLCPTVRPVQRPLSPANKLLCGCVVDMTGRFNGPPYSQCLRVKNERQGRTVRSSEICRAASPFRCRE